MFFPCAVISENTFECQMKTSVVSSSSSVAQLYCLECMYVSIAAECNLKSCPFQGCVGLAEVCLFVPVKRAEISETMKGYDLENKKESMYAINF